MVNRVDIKSILKDPIYKQKLIERAVKSARELSKGPSHEVGNRIQKAIDGLSSELRTERREALAGGYKDEECSKCGQVFLAHHHLVKCDLAVCGDCPMVKTGTKSIFEYALGIEEEDKEDMEKLNVKINLWGMSGEADWTSESSKG